jgi:hypothetical protein
VNEDLPEQAHRAELHMFPTWVLKLDKRDSLLVLKALGGRLANDEERGL